MGWQCPTRVQRSDLTDSTDPYRFPKIPKDVLKATLDFVAVRVGQKESEKKWVCK